MIRSRTLELAAGLDAVHVQATTTRANGLAVGFRPPQLTELEVSRLFAVLIDRFE